MTDNKTQSPFGREEDLLTPPGRMIDVDGHKMHVYSVGKGDKTLVLMAASGTVCPSLDFKNLYSGLGDDCRIVVVENSDTDTVILLTGHYAEGLNFVSFAELDCGHYIFHFESERITEEINAFLYDLD